jgi:hypothetical protein
MSSTNITYPLTMLEELIAPQAKTPKAVTWIRDGVLINRMHVNPVAFAVTYWLFTKPAGRSGLGLEQLINFGFAQSGISCAEKITLFSAEWGHNTEHLPSKIDQAVDFYNELATAMALRCTYFVGAVDLVKRLHKQGVLNFITSAVEQDVLDTWAQTKEGLEVSPYLTEILGKRPSFVKGRDHFARVSELANGGVIYCVADAPAEINMAARLSREYNIMPIGFAHAVQKRHVMQALALAEKLIMHPAALWNVRPPYATAKGEMKVTEGLIYLPDIVQVVEALEAAGAAVVVAGEAQVIVSGLSSLLHMPGEQP